MNYIKLGLAAGQELHKIWRRHTQHINDHEKYLDFQKGVVVYLLIAIISLLRVIAGETVPKSEFTKSLIEEIFTRCGVNWNLEEINKRLCKTSQNHEQVD